MQQKKPSIVLPLPSFKESFGQEEAMGKMKQQKRIEGGPHLEAQMALLHARIFGLENPRYQKAIGELVMSQIPVSQLKIADQNAKKYKQALINALKSQGVIYKWVGGSIQWRNEQRKK